MKSIDCVLSLIKNISIVFGVYFLYLFEFGIVFKDKALQEAYLKRFEGELLFSYVLNWICCIDLSRI